MALNLNINGVNYNYPESGDTGWGNSTTDWAQAVTSGMLQKAGGTFTLTSNVDFGASFGLVSVYFSARSNNIASTGTLRLSQSNFIAYRNAANNGDLALAVNSSDELLFDGDTVLTSLSLVPTDTATIDMTLVGTALSASIINDSITNAMINSSAAIALSKLAATTASRALQSGSGGLIEVSATTSTQLGYLSTTTSDVQTQLNSKLNLSGGTLTGSLLLNADPSIALQAATKQYVDNAMLGLNPLASALIGTTANITLSGEQTIDGETTSTSRVLVKNQTLPAENGIYTSGAGAWTRTTDADTYAELVQAYVLVTTGTANEGTGWLCTASPGGTIGVDPINFVQFSSATVITTDGQGIEIAGNSISLELDGTTLSKSASGLKVNEIANAQIAAAAAIAVNKLAALTASRAVVSDGSGFLASATTTATEIGYVNGVTSAIQTQLDAKTTNPMTTNGDIIIRAAGVPARLAVGSTGQFLGVSSGLPAYLSPNPVQTLAGDLVLTSADNNKVLLVSTAAARSITLPAPAANFKITIKDKTGQAATNNITLVRNGSEAIEGVSANKLLQTNWGCFTIISDGTDYFII